MTQETFETVTDEYLCNLAREYVLKQYAPEGQRLYSWEESNNPNDDTDFEAVVSEWLPGCPPDNYSWSEVSSCEVIHCEVDERNDTTKEYIVQVIANILISEGNSDDDDETISEESEPDFRAIWCNIVADDDTGELFVDEADE